MASDAPLFYCDFRYRLILVVLQIHRRKSAKLRKMIEYPVNFLRAVSHLPQMHLLRLPFDRLGSHQIVDVLIHFPPHFLPKFT